MKMTLSLLLGSSCWFAVAAPTDALDANILSKPQAYQPLLQATSLPVAQPLSWLQANQQVADAAMDHQGMDHQGMDHSQHQQQKPESHQGMDHSQHQQHKPESHQGMDHSQHQQQMSESQQGMDHSQHHQPSPVNSLCQKQQTPPCKEEQDE